MFEVLPRKTTISFAQPSDREAIYAMRHAVYAEELGQHKPTAEGMISDPLDEFNIYIVARIDGELAGFISVTPPTGGRYSIDKYVARESIAVSFDEGLYELRILTVARRHRSSRLAGVLMYAAFRWAEEQGATHIVAMGRTDVLSIYLKHGLLPLGRQVRSGAVTYELLESSVERGRGFIERHNHYYERLQAEVVWDVDFPYFKPACCFHGGAFFDAIGTGFDSLERRETIVNADVLDAWFPPSPRVLSTLVEHLPWLVSTSPPTHSDGLRAAIARSRGVRKENILPGAGSSDLIYMALRKWLTSSSRVLILDPTYGEYVHILENVIGCTVDRLVLSRSSSYVVDLEELAALTQLDYDLIVLVNPNSPTGQHIPGVCLERVLAGVPKRTRVWVDETYVEYAGPAQSLEAFAARTENVIVCKSMSKVYALSGIRAAYLCASMHQLSELVAITPPWAVSLPAQVAAVRALEDESYYAERYRETHGLREELKDGLRSLGIEEIVPGTANFVLCHLEPEQPTAADVVSESRKYGVFLRDASLMGTELGPRALRIAVKDRATNAIVIGTLERVFDAAALASGAPLMQISA